MKRSLCRALVCCALTSALVLNGCPPKNQLFEDQRRVDRQDKAGSVQIAVIARDHWDDYRDAMQPKFALDEKQALAEAIPQTMALEEQFINILEAALQVNLQQTLKTSKKTTKTETGKDPVDTEETTEETKPGEVPDVDLGDLPGSRGTAPAPGALLKNGVGTDAFLKYLTATALFQEVHLLNKYVQSAAMQRNYKPYVVRLQVTTLPGARNQPYDSYINLSFFSGGFSAENPPPPLPVQPRSASGESTKSAKGAELGAAVVAADQLTTDAAGTAADGTPPTPDPVTGDNTNAAAGGAGGSLSTAEFTPVVVPLLVTDNVESAIHSRSVDTIRQYALGLSALIQGVGVGGQVQSFAERLQAALGQDFNSVYTVSRLSDNTLRIRIGAQHQTASQYASITRTNNVTVLLLIPEKLEKEKVRVVGRTSMVDAYTGEPLPILSSDAVLARAEAVLRRHQLGSSATRTQLAARILGAASLNNRALFDRYVRQEKKEGQHVFETLVFSGGPTTAEAEKENERLRKENEALKKRLDTRGRFGRRSDEKASAPRPIYADALWADMLNVRLASPYTFASFELPEALAQPAIPTQNAVAFDNGTVATVTLQGTTGLHRIPLFAVLSMDANNPVGVAATAVSADRNLNQLVLRFPSPTALGVTPTHVIVKEVSADANAFISTHALTIRAAEKKNPGFTLEASSELLRSSGGSGSIQFRVTKVPNATAQSLIFKIGGAVVDAAPTSTGSPIAEEGNGWRVNGDAAVTVNLKGLLPNTKVTVSATDTEKVTVPGVSWHVIDVPVPQKPSGPGHGG